MASATAAAQRLPRVFDKYMLPKVAMVLVSLASLLGGIITGLRHEWFHPAILVTRWATLWLLALLLGSQMWKLLYLRPSVHSRPVPQAIDYAAAMITLHRRWQGGLAVAATVAVTITLAMYAGRDSAVQLWALLASIGAVVALGAIAFSWRKPVCSPTEAEPSAWVILSALAATVLSLAGMDVAQETGRFVSWLTLNRGLHLLAFSAWLGGALWNVFIAVPAALPRVNFDTVILANLQLERFRVVVRAVFPTIIITGLIQIWQIFSINWSALTSSWLGYLVLAKIGLIVTLVGVFITCPMWRACSPIRGVCDLDDLE